jgi:hypothetical protein
MCLEMVDIFQQCGVAVVLRVKRAVLERVSRCTGAIIFDSLDHMQAVDPDQWVSYWLREGLRERMRKGDKEERREEERRRRQIEGRREGGTAGSEGM